MKSTWMRIYANKNKDLKRLHKKQYKTMSKVEHASTRLVSIRLKEKNINHESKHKSIRYLIMKKIINISSKNLWKPHKVTQEAYIPSNSKFNKKQPNLAT